MPQEFIHFDSESLVVKGKVENYIPSTFFSSHVVYFDFNKQKQMPLYKFYNIRALTPLLTNHMLYIDRVNTWEDVYENFFLKAHLFHKSLRAPIVTDQIVNAIFGQCWTYAPETDAMWRIYSQNKTGIRIQTNVEKLLSAIFVDDSCIADTWLGIINYSSAQDINNYVLKNTKIDSISIWRNLMPQTQFLKRKEFEHEKEFRIIKMIESSTADKIVSYKRLAFEIDIDYFIDSYLLDPRLDDETFMQQKEYLIKLGADPNKISKSDLYSFKPLDIIIDN